MTIAVYIRVSSPKGQKTDSQRAEVEAWINRQRIKRARWFEDRDSATNLQRDAFKKLQDAIFAGEIDTVVVWKLDRLARNLKEGVNVLADWCQRGVRVIAITQQIDLSGPVGNLIASPVIRHCRDRIAALQGASGHRYCPSQKTRRLYRTPIRHNESHARASASFEKTEADHSGNRPSTRR